ncbi:malate dehydrogenase [Clostridia bacterium]|nr:malate dehydrogenase [Clostridia bacterium]
MRGDFDRATGSENMNYLEESLRLHREWRGKLETIPKMSVETSEELSLAYTPGVAAACLAIAKNPAESFALTGRANTVAVVTDGTAVLGLGDIGALAAMPVMEGKCVLFKAFGGLDAVPICIDSKDTDEIVRTVALLAGNFGGINLEDIAAPRCFEIERRLKEICAIPVCHDDQHGTAIVVLAAMLNALRVCGKDKKKIQVVINGAGAAGVAIAKILLSEGFANVTICDKSGALYQGAADLNSEQEELAKLTNLSRKKGTLADALQGADAFIGVSAPAVLTPEMIRAMADKPIIFPMANPTPEIMPELAKEAGAYIVGTGRSDYPNQINNVLAFPALFRGALSVYATDINGAMELAAARALSELVSDDELSADYILPKAFDPRIREFVSAAVARAAIESGAVR